MRKMVCDTLFQMFLLIAIAALSAYPTDIRLWDGGEFKEMSDDSAQKFGKIVEAFDGEIEGIKVTNDGSHKHRILLSFDVGVKERKSQNRHLENFVNTIRSVKDAGSDSRYVYINATTGKTEREDSDVKRSMMSGKVKG